MNTTVTMDETEDRKELPGALLASIRAQKGYSTAYVAGKLHLRVRLIELLEADDYGNMPEPVFIKGYLRAYAKLLDVSEVPLLETFNKVYDAPEKKIERALWQSKRETHTVEYAIRWLTALFALGVIIAVAFWWQNNKGNEHLFPQVTEVSHTETQPNNKTESDIRLTDLSKMRSLLSSANQYSPMEKEGD